MKKIGILGGMSAESTIEYYRLLIDIAKDELEKDVYPELIIYNLNFKDFCKPMSQGRDAEVVSLLTDKVKSLSKAGADFAIIASNTPHIHFDVVENNSPIPLLSIIEATADEASDRGYDRVGLLGTDFVMSSNMYKEAMKERGIEVFTPGDDDRMLVHDIIMNELVSGSITEQIRDKLIKVVDGLKQNDLDSIILGCTELPLVLNSDAVNLPVLNTTEIHVKKAFECARQSSRI